ncbi:uncharacterized protein CLV78_101811 [Aliiruegeria haliotis]|uniref:Lysozyme inhibitor LprI N-terminal domain-containing protein n=1 Tax=Aliiruegeria haliotis TaxID=1280846 RepID=A0A2T0RZY8_9RHOB|nr:MliC family protein [Aliiruegeria haliotis]PRY26710.1 uncharacterized protein CLV78_101811 [Aliiruegeria haliotis]
MKLRISCLVVALGIGAGMAAAEPAFDCAKAESDAEVAICGSEALGELDRELARLYALAVEGPNMTADRLDELKATQRGWIKGRDECWKSSFPLETCIANEYAFRIDELRTGYADARSEEGASLGPFPYACEGFGALVSAVFVNTSEPLVTLRWRDVAVVLPRVESGSGSHYETDNWDGKTISFWVKGKEATLLTGVGETLSCVEDAMG